MLQRVLKSDVQIDTWVKPDGLDLCLECWKTWMGRSDTDLGAQTQKTLRGEGDGYGSPDTGASRRDNEIAEATDAMIGSLKAAHRWAIYRRTGISTMWRFPLLDYMETAKQADLHLIAMLKNNVATRLLF